VPHPLLEEAWRLHRAGDHAGAVGLYESVLRSEPDNFDALHLLGLLHGQNGRFEQAQFFTGQAAKLRPFSAEVLFLRSFALTKLDRIEEALSCLDAVLAINPALMEALQNRASLLFRLRRYEEAAQCFGQILSRDPAFAFARGNRLFARLQNCDWREFDTERDAILAGIASGARIIAPFQAKALGLTPEQELRCTRIWTASEYRPRPPLCHGEVRAHERIRVAYVSADFREHAVARLMAGVFEHHDRSRFETIAVSFGPDDGSEMRARLMRSFDRFFDVRSQSEGDIARLIHGLEVDIAVDLMGYTEGCRPGVFALRPAPLQVNFLGFPGTMAADFMDYLIADAIVVPAGEERHYAEKIVTLPDTFLPADCRRAVAPQIPSRAGQGVPESGFVFCCFNAGYKIAPVLFDIWMRLLACLPESVLWLGQANGSAQQNLRREAQSRSVSPERLIFAPFVDSAAAHLARLKLADLFLDTPPYHAHATAIDALSVGLPILTCRGPAFAGRVGVSLLHAAGVPELVAETLADYENLALSLAREPARLAMVRTKLAASPGLPPFDIARFTRHLEAAYAAMWNRHRNGRPPAGFAVP